VLVGERMGEIAIVLTHQAIVQSLMVLLKSTRIVLWLKGITQKE
jgi:hypothetical protein